jgi:predicted O-methyltransferase YrrM
MIKHIRKKLSKFVSGLNSVKLLQEQVNRQGEYPAGHYSSPIPSEEDIEQETEALIDVNHRIPGIDLNDENQKQRLLEYLPFYKELPFPFSKTSEFRYYYDNVWFGYSDAIFLYCFLRYQKPRAIIEIGSGYSSAVMLDTIDRFFNESPKLTFVEPYPDRLRNLLNKNDLNYVRLIEKPIQKCDVEIFSGLASGDLVFIDSSHVSKYKSDLNFLMFEVLPQVPVGAFVHFHDIFFPFEYPLDWLENGKYWNENYLLRAFLTNNDSWEIVFFNHYLNLKYKDVIDESFPLCSKNAGGSIYLRKVA